MKTKYKNSHIEYKVKFKEGLSIIASMIKEKSKESKPKQKNSIPVKALKNNLEIKLFRNLAYQFDINLNFNVLYTDFDDCLIFGDKVNDKLVQFIFQCINKNIKVVLITRHADDIHQTLKNMRLSQLFDQVIHITDGAPKSQFITEKNAIFIDDSFAERLDVMGVCNIPCFSVDMVQGLTCLKN